MANAARAGAAVVLLLLATAAGAAVEQRAAPAAESSAELQALEKRRVDLRTHIWTVYPATAAFGADGRGRTLGQDVNDWVLADDVRGRLDGLFRGAATLQQRGDPKAAATLQAVRELLVEQERRAELILAYWTQNELLNRQREAWRDMVGRVPATVGAASRARLEDKEHKLLQDYAAIASLDVVGSDVEALKSAYNRERLSLAGVYSDTSELFRQAPGRLRWRPCPPAAVPATVPSADSNVKVVSAAAADKFFPEYARAANITGRVLVLATIDAQGCMVESKVVQSAGLAMLDDAALDMLEYTRFAPAQAKGRAIRSSVKIPVVFQFDSETARAESGAPDVKQLDAFIDKGYAAMNLGNYDEALAAFDAALAIDPNSSMALADRSFVRTYRRDFAGARADLDAAQASNPNNAVVYRGRGILAAAQGDHEATIAAVSRALELDRTSSFAFYHRCLAHAERGETDTALADCADAVRLQPAYLDARTLRALLFRSKGDSDSSLAQAGELIAAEPKADWARVPAAFIYSASGDDARAAQEFAHALQIKAADRTYVSRAYFRRLRGDDAGAAEDLRAALTLNPTYAVALLRLCELQLDTQDYAAVLESVAQGLALDASDPDFLVLRAIAQTRLQRPVPAQQDLAAAQAAAKTPAQLNTLCWSLATYDVALRMALTACDAAVAAQPRSMGLADSRAFVLLRLGRFDESIKQYDAAIAMRTVAAGPFYGRGLAKRLQGDAGGAEVDMRHAKRLDAHIAATYARMGFNP